MEILTLTMDFLLWNFKSTNSTSPSQHELLKGCISLILALMADKRIPQGIWTKVENSLMIIYGCDQLPVGEKLEILCLVEQLMKDEEERSKLLGEKFEESIVQIRGQVKFERLQLAFAYLIPLLIKMQRDGQEMMVANCLMVADFQPATYEFALILQLLSEDSLLLLIGETSRLSEKLISMLNQRLKAKDTSDIPIGIFTQIIDKIRENENLYQLAVSSELLLTTVDLSDSDICDEND